MNKSLSLNSFSEETKTLIKQSQKFADEDKCRHLDPAHVLVMLLDVPEVVSAFKSMKVDTVRFNSKLQHYVRGLGAGEPTCTLSPNTIALFEQAAKFVAIENRLVNVFDLLYVLVQEKTGIVSHLCGEFNITPEKVSGFLESGKQRDIDHSPYITNLSLQASSQPFDPVIGRDDEVRRLIRVLGRKSKNHPLLIGEAGVGKRTIVLALVSRILKGSSTNQIPRTFDNTTVVQLNTSALLAGATARADIESRMNQVLHSLKGNNVILYVRSLEALLSSGLNPNLTDFFRSVFDMSNVRVITSISTAGSKKLVEKENALFKEFTSIQIDPCTSECAVEILRGVASRYQKHHNIRIGDAAIALTVNLAKRYVQDRFLPESAIDLLDEAASNKMMSVNGSPVKLDKAIGRASSIRAQLGGMSPTDSTDAKVRKALQQELNRLESEIVIEREQFDRSMVSATLTEESIAIVLGEWTGIPVNKFLEGETERLARMEEDLCQRIVGQNDALKAIAKSVRRSYTGLRDINKPIGSFLFLGSSGVGKTEVSKALAAFLFGDEAAMTRIDMSEFREAHMAQRLIGAPPGYQGADQGGFLTEAVRRRPYSVILFDEVEKAHPDVFNLLLQVLDDGRLTDGRGHTADFSNTIIVMTSNIGSKKILELDPSTFENPKGLAELNTMLHNEMKNFLRPEFINRIDETIVFKPLDRKNLAGILNIQLKNLDKILSGRGIKLSVSDAAKEKLVNIGYNPAYGARPLKRAIMKNIQDPLAEALVKGNCHDGISLKVFLQDDNFVIEEE